MAMALLKGTSIRLIFNHAKSVGTSIRHEPWQERQAFRRQSEGAG